MSYRKHWHLGLAAGLCVGLLSVGCKKEGGASGSAEESGADRPAVVENNKSAAGSLKAPPMFANIPADTPYVFASFEPFPGSYVEKVMGSMGPLFDEAVNSIQTQGAGSGPEAQLASAVMEELKGKLSANGLESLGFKTDVRFAIYGVQWYPVFRFELADGAALRAAVERIETRFGQKAPRKTLGGIEYIGFGDSDVGALVSIQDKELVMAMYAQKDADKVVPIILGVHKPAKSMADGAALKKLAAEYGFAPYGLGYFDSVRALQMAMDELGGALSGACKKELLASVNKMPRVVLGYDEVTDKTMSMTLMVEMVPELAEKLKKLHASVPGVTTKFDPPPLFAIGGGINPEAAIGVGRDLSANLLRLGKVCDIDDMVDAGEDMARDLDQPIPPQIAGIRGGALVALDVQMGISGMPTDISGYAMIGAKDPKKLIEFANTLGKQMGLQIQAGGDFKKQDFDVPFLPDMYVAAKDKVIAIAAGQKGVDAANAAMKNKSASPLFFVAYDYGRILQLASGAGESIGPFGQNEPAQKFLEAQSKVWGLLAIWAYASDRGLGIRMKMDMK